MRQQEYFIALEIAEMAKRFGVENVAHTRQGVEAMAKREAWAETTLARLREGRGNGIEYHYSLLPLTFQSKMIAAEDQQRLIVKSKALEAQKQEALARLGSDSLTARQRSVMEARASIIYAVRAYAIEHGLNANGKAVKAIVERSKTDPAFAEIAHRANNRSGKRRALSRATVYEWLKLYNEGGEHPSALVPSATRATHSFPSWWPVFLNYYLQPQKPTITAALDDLRYKAQLENVPSYEQIRRCLKKLDKREGTQARHKGREGVLALKARHAYVVRDTSGLLPTSVYTADGKTFDAEVQHPIHGRPFRPEITSILDVATRKCVGWSVGLAENAKDVRDALRVACIWNGIPAVFYVDRGPGFKNDAMDNELTGFCVLFGTTKMHSLPYNSQARGIIERFNGSVYNPLARQYESYIGVDMDREARHKNFKESRKQLREYGASSLILSFPEFMAAVGQAIERYNDTQHDGLTYRDGNNRKRSVTPNEAWESARLDGFEPELLHPVEADELFRQSFKRKTRRGMVSFNSNDYFHEKLVPFDGLEILVGVDFHDGSKVWCREIDILDGEQQPGKLIAVAIFEGNKERYIPWSMEQDAIEKRAKGRLRRLHTHIDEVEAEANPNRFLEQPSNPIFTIDGDANDVTELTEQMRKEALPSKPRLVGDRPIFDDDASFAKWCCSNPNKLTERDLSLLRSLARSKSDREYLRTHQVDLEALEQLIRSAA